MVNGVINLLAKVTLAKVTLNEAYRRRRDVGEWTEG